MRQQEQEAMEALKRDVIDWRAIERDKRDNYEAND